MSDSHCPWVWNCGSFQKFDFDSSLSFYQSALTTIANSYSSCSPSSSVSFFSTTWDTHVSGYTYFYSLPLNPTSLLDRIDINRTTRPLPIMHPPCQTLRDNKLRHVHILRHGLGDAPTLLDNRAPRVPAVATLATDDHTRSV
jgi:hypothetical protein